jgi:hypothetical protein
VGEYSTHASSPPVWTQGVGISRSFISRCESPLMGKPRKRAEIPAIPKNSAELAANFEDSRNQRGLYFPRRAHRTTTICSQKPPRFPGKGRDECLQGRVKMDRPKRGRSARWGAACAPCAAAKTRCIRTQSWGPQQCDRCRSLEKDCVGQTSRLRKKRQAKPS